MFRPYQKKGREEQMDDIGNALENYIREVVCPPDVNSVIRGGSHTFLGRNHYEMGKEFRVYRHGYHSKRKATVGLEPVEVRLSHG